LTIHLLHVPDPGVPPPPDIRPPAYGGAVAIDPADPQPVTIQIWAAITAPDNGTMIDDGLYKFYSAYRSSDGGLILGDLKADYNHVGGHKHRWFTGEGGNRGFQNDLEGEIDMTAPGHYDKDTNPDGADSDYNFYPRSGDGDLDISHTDVKKPGPPWFQVRNRSGRQYTDEDYSWYEGSPGPLGNPTNDWLIAYLTFTPLAPEDGGWQGPDWDENPDRPGVTEIWADPRQYGAAIWEENGQTKNNLTDPEPGDPVAGTMLGGERVILYVASTAAAPSGGPFVLGPGGDAVLDGTAATGSINWWGWDFDGDGDYDLEGTGEVAHVTFDMLKGLDDATVTEGEEWPDGVMKPGTMTVGWSASDPVNTDTVAFELTIIPEPATIALLVAGALVTRVRRRR